MSENKFSTIMNFSVPIDFIPIKTEADTLLEKDPRFKQMQKGIEKRYLKKTKYNKLNSLKMRFYIDFYRKFRKRELDKLKKEKEEENDKRNQTDDQKEKDT